MEQLQPQSQFFNPSFVALQAKAEPESSTFFQKVSTVFWTVINTLRTVLHLITLPLYSLLDDGLANVLGLQSLRHGTCLTNYVSILTSGGDPSHGGKESGSSLGGIDVMGENQAQSYSKNSKDYFHVFADGNFKAVETTRIYSSGQEDADETSIETKEIGHFQWLLREGMVRLFPTMHATFSGMGTFVSPESKGCMSTAGRVAGAALNFFTPTVRFKFTSEEMKGRFERDLDYGGVALKTKTKIEPWRVGIVGSLAVGLNIGVFKRIFDHPIKFLIGVIELVAAVALAALAAMAIALI